MKTKRNWNWNWKRLELFGSRFDLAYLIVKKTSTMIGVALSHCHGNCSPYENVIVTLWTVKWLNQYTWKAKIKKHPIDLNETERWTEVEWNVIIDMQICLLEQTSYFSPSTIGTAFGGFDVSNSVWTFFCNEKHSTNSSRNVFFGAGSLAHCITTSGGFECDSEPKAAWTAPPFCWVSTESSIFSGSLALLSFK